MTTVQDVGAVASRPLVAGDSLELVVTVLDGDDVAVDITTATAIRYGVARIGAGGEPALPLLLQKALGSGVAITDGQGGIFTVTLTAGDTDGLNGTYHHEAEVITADGKTATVFRGKLQVEPQVLLPGG